jgi:hypothetical protein
MRCLKRVHVKLASLFFVTDKGHFVNHHHRLRPSSGRAVFSLNAVPAEESFQYFHCPVMNITEKRGSVLFCFFLFCMGVKPGRLY